MRPSIRRAVQGMLVAVSLIADLSLRRGSSGPPRIVWGLYHWQRPAAFGLSAVGTSIYGPTATLTNCSDQGSRLRARFIDSQPPLAAR